MRPSIESADLIPGSLRRDGLSASIVRSGVVTREYG
jgi:hypothetical protein